MGVRGCLGQREGRGGALKSKGRGEVGEAEGAGGEGLRGSEGGRSWKARFVRQGEGHLSPTRPST